MLPQVDPEVLAGFVDEVRGYLPQLQEPLAALGTLPVPAEKVIEAHLYAHRLRGSASMLGLNDLSQAAATLEEILDLVAQGHMDFDPEWAPVLAGTVPVIDAFLCQLSGADGADTLFPDEVLQTYRSLLEIACPATSSESPLSFEDDEFDVVAPIPSEVSAEVAGDQAGVGDVAPELLEVFQVEAEEYLRELGSLVPKLAEDIGNRELLQSIRRAAHTLKGAAAMVGFEVVNRLTHRMEDLLDQVYEGTQSIDVVVIGLLFAATDALEDLIAGKADADVVRQLYERYDERLGRVEAPLEVPAPPVAPVAEAPSLPEAESEPAAKPAAPVTRTRKSARHSSPVVRASVEQLETVSRLVGELVITRAALEQRLARIFDNLGELRASTRRLETVGTTLESEYETWATADRPLSEAFESVNGTGPAALSSDEAYGFDDLEFDRYTEFNLLTRALTETTGDIRSVTEELEQVASDVESLLSRQGRQSSEVEERLKKMRMVPLSILATRLERTVRNVADRQGKEVVLVLEGGETTLEKSALEAMADSLLHILRNAVDHGIEAPEFRVAVGKPRSGKICVRALQEGNQVVIRVEDDGAGLHPHAVRSAAVSRGFLAPEAAAELSDDRARELIFLPGFSTARSVSEVSGRGVGLDVVRHTIHKLEGTIRVESVPGRGTAFIFTLPLTVGLTRSLVVRANQETFAIPLQAVSQVLRINRAEIEPAAGGATIRLGEKHCPLLFLGELLNLKQPAATSEVVPVLVLNVAGRQTGLAVDQVVGGREVIIKRLASHVRRVHGITGATLLGDGKVVLILNPAELVAGAPPALTGEQRALPPSETASNPLTVMVVDDSPSVRRVASNLIRRGGWVPVLAKDGMECLDTLYRSGTQPDIILLDIEMPRMDGYEVLSALRSQDTYRDLPVVVVTSRSGEKHRRKAADLGASGYLVKPYPDEALFTVVRNLLAHTGKPLGL
jgi:chemosensory pili system protein ChpA (sensor histidine kinase/response regulator)